MLKPLPSSLAMMFIASTKDFFRSVGYLGCGLLCIDQIGLVLLSALGGLLRMAVSWAQPFLLYSEMVCVTLL